MNREIQNIQWLVSEIKRSPSLIVDEAERQSSSTASVCSAPILVPVPDVARLATTGEKVSAVQSFVDGLQYNFTGHGFFNLGKKRSVSHILMEGRAIAKEQLPIKCLEAVFVSLYLTRELGTEIERIPVAFKSRMDGHVHRHIVLAVVDKASKKWGSLGLSRRPELGFKPLAFDSLWALILDYEASYAANFHTLRRFKLGLPVPFDTYSKAQIVWKYLTVPLHPLRDADSCSTLLHRENVSQICQEYCNQYAEAVSQYTSTGIVDRAWTKELQHRFALNLEAEISDQDQDDAEDAPEGSSAQ
eukprot:ANDGO_05596.mRNA.1 hypothetical protein